MQMHIPLDAQIGSSVVLALGKQMVLGGSWDLVTRVIYKITILISTYNPNKGTYDCTY